MHTEFVSAARKEAQRFLERVADLESLGHRAGHYDQYKFTAAVRRASMDLTRALAALRGRPNG